MKRKYYIMIIIGAVVLIIGALFLLRTIGLLDILNLPAHSSPGLGGGGLG